MRKYVMSPMRQFLMMLTIISILLVSITAAQETGVKFYKLKLPDAIAKAKKENKIVMIEFWAPSCLPCINLSKNVFQNPKYGDYLNTYLISIKLSPADKEYEPLWKKYNLIVQSTVVFLNGKGEEIERRCDYDGDSEKYFNFIKDVINGKNLYSDLIKEYNRDSLNAETNYRLAIKNIDRYEYTKANRYLNNVIRLDRENKYGIVDDSKYRLAYYDYSFKSNFNKLADYLRTTNSKQHLSTGYVAMINHYINKKEKDLCINICKEAIQKLDNDADIYNKYAWAIYTFGLKTEFPRGLELTKKAISINPNKAGYYDTQAWLYLGDGNAAKAVESITKAIELNPHPEYKKNLEMMKSAVK